MQTHDVYYEYTNSLIVILDVFRPCMGVYCNDVIDTYCVTKDFFSNYNELVIVKTLYFFHISGVVAWIPAGKFAQSYSVLSILSNIEFPYSVLLMGVGASLALLNAVIIFILIFKSNRGGQSGHTIQTGYPMQQVAQGPNTGYPAQNYPAQGYTNQGYMDNHNAYRKYWKTRTSITYNIAYCLTRVCAFAAFTIEGILSAIEVQTRKNKWHRIYLSNMCVSNCRAVTFLNAHVQL